MANSRKEYSIEIQAHRDGYELKDATGKDLKGDTFWKTEFGSPEVLKSGFEPNDVLKKWKQSLPVCSN